MWIDQKVWQKTENKFIAIKKNYKEYSECSLTFILMPIGYSNLSFYLFTYNFLSSVTSAEKHPNEEPVCVCNGSGHIDFLMLIG